MAKVLFGFKVPSGEPLYIEPQHLVSLGMTQLSGKTTANEAMISRSGARGIAFITKRGEAGFQTYTRTKPYFKEQRGWQYVESLVNVALGEKVKYEPRMRYAIMKVSRDMKTLQDVRDKAVALLETAKKEWDKEVYSKLIAYLDLVLPELEQIDFADKVTLKEGVNVMDLVGMKLQTQQLIISSTLQYIYEHLDGVIAIIPEAWEHLPQSRKTPVKFVAEQFIRKGASVKNFLWLDTQDIGGVDKTPLRQVSTWVIGRMMEAHEVERLLKQLLGLKVPPREIQTLSLGHFYVVHSTQVDKAYALPVGVPEDVGRKVAMGELTPEYVREHYLMTAMSPRTVEDAYLRKTMKSLEDKNKTLQERLDASVDQYGKLAEEHKDLTKHNDTLTQIVESHVATIHTLETQLTAIEPLRAFIGSLVQVDIGKAQQEIEAFCQNEMAHIHELIQGKVQDMLDHPEIHEITVPTQVNISKKIPKLAVTKTLKILNLDDSTLRGKVALLYVEGGYGTRWFSVSNVYDIFANRGWNKSPRIMQMLTELCQWGFLETKRSGHKAREFHVKMTPKEAKEKGLLTFKEVKQ